MKLYSYAFSGQVSVKAETEEEAYQKVDELLGATGFQIINSEDFGVDEIELLDEEECEEE